MDDVLDEEKEKEKREIFREKDIDRFEISASLETSRLAMNSRADRCSKIINSASRRNDGNEKQGIRRKWKTTEIEESCTK